MKTVKITPPEGYEIDKEKSTFEEIVFKPIEKKLPKSWEEIENLRGWWIDYDSTLHEAGITSDRIPDDRNIFPTKEIAEAVLELAQLLQLRDVYRQGWKPNWNYPDQKIFSFQSTKIRDLFLENFKDKLQKLLPLSE